MIYYFLTKMLIYVIFNISRLLHLHNNIMEFNLNKHHLRQIN